MFYRKTPNSLTKKMVFLANYRTFIIASGILVWLIRLCTVSKDTRRYPVCFCRLGNTELVVAEMVHNLCDQLASWFDKCSIKVFIWLMRLFY